ncbi:NADPH-dependent F420 reductase [Candidatus Hodarchaeum mangrovi]
MSLQIGMIGGTGPQGQGLAIRWGLVNEKIIIGSRSQEKAKVISNQVNEKLGKELCIPRINEDCVKESEIVLLTVPFEHVISTLKPLIPLFTPKHILVDVTVPLKPFEKGKMVDILPENQIYAKSATELLRDILPDDVPVVGAFKTLSNAILRDIDRLPELNQDVFILGREKEAKRIIKQKAELIHNLRAVDAGGTLSARHVERFTAFLIGLNVRYKTHDCGFMVTGLPKKK